MVFHTGHAPGDVAYITSGQDVTSFTFMDPSWKPRVNLTYLQTNDTRNIIIQLHNVSMNDTGMYKLIRRPSWQSIACFHLSFLSKY